MSRTRRIGAELFAALSDWRAALRNLRPPMTPVGQTMGGEDMRRRVLRDMRVSECEVRVMALLNDDIGLCSEDQ